MPLLFVYFFVKFFYNKLIFGLFFNIEFNIRQRQIDKRNKSLWNDSTKDAVNAFEIKTNNFNETLLPHYSF